MKVLVTGASGFLGRYVVEALVDRDDCDVVGTTRRAVEAVPGSVYVSGMEVHSDTDWSDVLLGVDVVVHCAARVHVSKTETNSEIALMNEVNVEGTLNLATQAADAGVKRLVFISSIGVLGDRTVDPFKGSEIPNPESPYARSKLQAEDELKSLSERRNFEYVIIRPPMIYGPGAPGNFARLVRFSSLPLPVGAATGLRSFVSVWNLTDLIVQCVERPEAKNQVFLVSDGEDLSSRDFIEAIATARGRSCLMPYVPSALMRFVLTALGKKGIWQSLFGTLQIDTSHTYTVLGWKPPVSFHDSIRRCFPATDRVF